MNDVAKEYLPANGNGHEKAFRIVRNDQPDYGPIEARDQVIEDNDLDLGARLMFVRIMDLSTRQGANDSYGVVTISQQKLSEKFGVSLRTIWNWKRQLLLKGVIWMSRKFMPNAWPMDTYHITKLDPPGRTEDKTTAEGMWGNGGRRQGPDQPGRGAREPGQRIIPGTGVRSNRFHSATGFQTSTKSSFLPTNASGNGNGLPVPVATNCHGEQQPIAAGSSNPLPLGAETGCEPERQPIATGSRNGLPLPAEMDCEHISPKSPVKSDFKVGEDLPTPEKQFQDWLKTLPGMFPSKLRRLESELIAKEKKATSREARQEWGRRIAAVRVQLHGGPVQDKARASTKSVRVEPKPTMTFEQQQAAWKKAKAALLPPSLKQKAAAKAAART